MSLLDDVSIVVTPNGYKAGELYAVIPSDGAADMDVTRATDATRVDENGLVEKLGANVPRIDYTGGGCPHILAEPQRTNLVTYSEDFSQWIDNSVSLEYNQGTSPDGDNNATRLYTSVDGNLYLPLANTSVVNTISFYVKSNNQSKDNFQLRLGGATINHTATSDWVRYTFTTTPNSTVAGIRNVPSEDLDILIWGAQLEAGSYGTSYIPTIGSTETRNQDIFTRDGIGSLINSTEGVLFVEMAALSTSIDNGYLSLNNGGNYQIRVGYLSGNIYIQIRINGAVPYSYSFVGTITDFNKIAVKWTATTQKVYVNGSPVNSGTASTIFPSGTLNNMEFAVNTVTPVFAKVKQLQVYDTALTDDQIRQITQ